MAGVLIMEDTILRILSLIDASGLTDKQILKELDLSSTSTLITDWRRGKSKSPTIKHILKIAHFFNVSTDFLLTGDIQASDLCNKEKELLKNFRSLPEQTQERVMGYIEGHLDAQKKPSQ